MEISRKRVAPGCAMGLLLLCLMGARGFSRDNEEARALRKKIGQQKIAKLQFADIELKDVIQYLRDTTKLNIQVRWGALLVAGIDRTTAVDLHLRDVTVEWVLKLILRDLSDAGTPLDYEIRENFVIISTREDLQRQTETRIYDIRDLIEASEDHEYDSEIRPATWEKKPPPRRMFYEEGDLGPGDADIDFIERPPRAERIDDLITLIRETIDPVTWRAEGGEVGTIRELNGRLIIRQSCRNHEALEDLLGRLRETMVWVPMVSVTARWVELDEADAVKLLAKGPLPREVPHAALEAAGAKTRYTATTSGFNGQRAHVASGRAESFVTSLDPVVAENAAGYKPIVEKLLFGPALEVRPLLSDEGGEVILSIRSVVSKPKKAGAHPVPPPVRVGDKQVNAPVKALDRLKLVVHTLRTTVRVPLGKPVLIGGATSPRTRKGRAMFLIVEVSASKARRRAPKR